MDFTKYFISGTISAKKYIKSRYIAALYMHIKVYDGLSVKQKVVTGQPIGTILNSFSHLHFELMVDPDPSWPSTARNGIGYYPNLQSLTDYGYIEPTRFIKDHLKNLESDKFPSESASTEISAERSICFPDLPKPQLVLLNTNEKNVRGQDIIYFNLSVSNYSDYSNALFVSAPHLPPCGLNKNSSRTWVDIFDGNNKRIYGFCALSSSEDLAKIWFGIKKGSVPPEEVYIKLIDRECGNEYISDTARISNIPASQIPVIQSLRIATLDEKGILRIKDMSGNTFDEFQIGTLADPQILWSPNGEYILLSESRDVRNIYLVSLESRRIEKWKSIPTGIRRLTWSPSSDRISADIASGKGWRQDIVSLDGITWRTSYKDWIVNNTAYWGPDGKFLAFAGSPSDYNFRLYLINADSGKITDRTPPGVFSTGFGNGWLNDGRLVFFAKSGFGETHDLLNPKTGSVTTLLHNPSVGRIGNIRISPSTKNIAYTTVEGDKHTLYLKGMNDTISKKKWSVDFAVDLYIESWSPLEDYVLFTVQSDRMGTIRRAYVLNTEENAVFPLDGNTYFFVQHKGYITSYRYWVTNKDFILSSVDWNSRLGNVFVTNVSGEKHELCNIRPNVSCAIWYP
jgi:Tol biopolymer transport system component